MTKITIKSDGGSRGNPGPAGIGYVVFNQKELVVEHGEHIGEATNNEAEYKAIIMALAWLEKYLRDLKKDNPISVECLLDSNLVVNQLSGKFKIKKPHLQILANQAFQIIQKIGSPITFRHIRRELNTEPDFLLNQALDSALKTQ